MDGESPANAYSDDELYALFRKLFPCGLAGADVREELGAEDWEESPFCAFFHPPLERAYEEYVSRSRNLAQLTGRLQEDLKPWETFRDEYRRNPCDPEAELLDLVGMCCWDIFSNNHEVFDATGRPVDIGSFRGAGAFLAHFANSGNAEMDEADKEGDIVRLYDRVDHMRYYMGTVYVEGRGDLGPVYRLIFQRMKSLGLVWVFHFPRLAAVDLSGGRDAPHSEQGLAYDPEESLKRERKAQRKREAFAKMRADLDRAYEKAVEKARHEQPPEIVMAHMAVYGRFPKGWPPRP